MCIARMKLPILSIREMIFFGGVGGGVGGGYRKKNAKFLFIFPLRGKKFSIILLDSTRLVGIILGVNAVRN